MRKPIFTGAATAMVTPMNRDGSINYKKYEELLDWQIESGINAIVVAGTTGETSTLSDEEHIRMIHLTCEKVNKRVPVIAGAGSNDTAYSVMLSKEAKSAGADALLHVSPYYNKTSQTGLIRHFSVIADATDLPVVLYNVPSRTGLDIKPETYLALSKHPNIRAIKEANGNTAAAAHTLSLCGDVLDMYSGNDDQIVPILSLGGKGVISVLSNVLPKETAEMCRLFAEGKTAESAALQLKLFELIDALFTETNPIPVKEAMNLLGHEVGPARLPLVEIGDAAKVKLAKALKGLSLLAN